MAIETSNLTTSIQNQMQSKGISGGFISQLSNAIAVGTYSFITSLTIVTQATGVAGAGKGTGTFILDPASGTSILQASFTGQSLKGEKINGIASSIALATSQVISSQGQVNTVVTGVANGTGIGQPTNANFALAQSFFNQSFKSNGLVGSKSVNLISGLSKGISRWFNTATIQTAITGVPTAPPSTTTGVGNGNVK